MTKRRNNIVLLRTGTPKRVTFAGRSFNANFRRATHKDLPTKTIRRTRTKRTKARKSLPVWLNSIGRRKHARKAARKVLATKRAIKRITGKKSPLFYSSKTFNCSFKTYKKTCCF